MRAANENLLISGLINELESSLELATTVPEPAYRRAKAETGSIGAHIRHNLDFVNALLRGVRTGSVDYADRERDQQVENDRHYAGWKIRATIESVNACAALDPGTLLVVRSEVRPEVLHRSSFSREVEFVYSHMVHHHALINERLLGGSIYLPAGLGVAPSTQAYRESLKLVA
jgi:hypothetical protein